MRNFRNVKSSFLSVTLLSGILLISVLPDVLAQNSKAAENVITDVDDRPLPPGGMDAMYAYFQTEMKYPEIAKEKGIEGTVVTTFNVQKDGSLTDVEILRGIGGNCDEEAVRLIQTMDNWQPGKVKGEAIVTRMRIPIRFILPEEIPTK